jgi:hypothetical protein
MPSPPVTGPVPGAPTLLPAAERQRRSLSAASAAALALGLVVFVLLATANSNGYRYGVSDQAFYAAAVIKKLNPTFYPRDSRLLESESRLMVCDSLMASLVRVLGVDQPTLSLWLYFAQLGLLFGAAVLFGRTLGLSWWAVAGLLVILTFRHRIARTGANSLEGYMHPRMIAFAFGVLALAMVAAGRFGRAAAWMAMAAVWHPTTTLWFGGVVVVAVLVARRDWWRFTVPACAIGLAAGAWAIVAGPVAGRLVVMDPAWLSVLAVKDYLFPGQWPLFAWAINLMYPVAIVAIVLRRRSQGLLTTGERALVAGLLALFGGFLASLPLVAWHLALAVQLQVTRVFWLLDFALAAYLAWWVFDDLLASRRVRLAVIGVLLAASTGRGVHLLSGDRHLFAARLPDTPWVQAMTWLQAQPPSLYVLADQGHAWKYGVSVRLAAEKDTFLEAGKDTSISMYDRAIALDVGRRLWEVRGFGQMTTAEARALAERYSLDVVVMEATHPLELPELYRNRQFVIYSLR